MGLDISVYKPISVGDMNPQDNFFILSENPELNIFSHLQFEKENEYYDLETGLKQLGYDFNDLNWKSSSYGEKVIFTFETKDGQEVELSEPPKITKKENCILVEEVGYQRKGANKQFYEDGMWDSPCVVDKNILLSHWEKYFSKNTPDSKGGFGSGVEFDLQDEEMKIRFKENIIDELLIG